MASILRRWESFWFPPVPVRRVALFRIAVAGFCAVELAFFARFLARYGTVDEQFARPVLIAEPLLRLGLPGVVPALYVVTLAALVMGTVGWKTRPSLFVGAAGYTVLYGLFNSFHKVNHGKITIVIALWALVVAPSGAAYAIDARRRRRSIPGDDEDVTSSLAGWTLRVTGVALVAAYVMSAVAKLRVSGFDWVTLPVVELALLARPANVVSTFMLEHPSTMVAAQVGLLAIELLAVLLLFGGRKRDVMAVVLAAFHIGALLLLNVEFWGYIVCLLAFYRLEDGADKLHQVLSAPLAGSAARNARTAVTLTANPAGHTGPSHAEGRAKRLAPARRVDASATSAPNGASRPKAHR